MMTEKIDFCKEKINLHERINIAIAELMQSHNITEIRFDNDDDDESNGTPFAVRSNTEIEEVKVRAIRCDEGLLTYQSNGEEGDEWNDMDICSDLFLGQNEDMYDFVYDYIQKIEENN